jgi:hypothetical protein
LGFVGWGLKSLLKNFDVPAVDDLFWERLAWNVQPKFSLTHDLARAATRPVVIFRSASRLQFSVALNQWSLIRSLEALFASARQLSALT